MNKLVNIWESFKENTLKRLLESINNRMDAWME